jgi:WD40 repeat protein
MAKPSIYTVGGTVQAGGGLYIARKADEDMLNLSRAGTFAYVLTSRQVGKSSLMVRTAEQLVKEGIRPVMIDLTGLGSKVTEEAWYLGLLTDIADKLHLETDVVTWWRSRNQLGATQRLTQFFREIVLTRIAEPVVIFVDEIDSTLGLPFTDDFYAAIRYLYNARATVPDFRRLSFVLIGVATPGDLIRDPKRTPFNIGSRVDITDFTYDEALPLTEGLELPTDESRKVLHWVIQWAGGHPYLTQRLCRVVAEQYRSNWTEEEIDRTVANTFFGKMSEHDNNLQFVRDMLTKRAPDKLAVLSTYKDIRLGRLPVRDEEQSPIKSHLKLSGVVKRDDGKLHVRNPIYRNVFDSGWIQEYWPVSWWQTVPLYAKLGSGLIVILAIAALVFALFAFDQLAEKEKYVDRLRVRGDSLNALLDSTRVLSRREANAKLAAEENAKRADDEAKRAKLSAEAEAQARALAEENRQRADERAAFAKKKESEASAALDTAKLRTQEKARLLLIEKARTLAEILAPQQLQAGNHEVAALLARQAFLFNQKNGGDLQNLIHDALMKTLQGEGGPQVLRGHTGGVRALEFFNNGDWLVSGSDDGTLRLWPRQKNYLESQTLAGHTGRVRALAAGSDNRTLFSGSEDRTVRAWNMQQDHLVSTPLSGHQDRVWAVALSPNGKILATGGADNTVRLWHADKLEAGAFVELPHPAWVRAVAFSADGAILAAGCNDGAIILWKISAEKTEKFAELKHEGGLKSLAFHPQQLILMSGGDGTLIQWRIDKTAEKQRIWPAHEADINAIVFSRDGRWLATASSDKKVKLWDFSQSSTPILTFAHDKFVWSVAFNANAGLLAAGCDDNNVYLWQTQTAVLAEKVCRKVKRNLTRDEWRAFISADIEYEKTCEKLSGFQEGKNTTTIRNEK